MALTRTVRPSYGSERARISTGTRPSRRPAAPDAGRAPRTPLARCALTSPAVVGRHELLDRAADEVGDVAAEHPARAGRWRRRTRPASVIAIPSKAAAARRSKRSSLSRSASSARSRSMAAPKTAAAALSASISEPTTPARSASRRSRGQPHQRLSQKMGTAANDFEPMRAGKPCSEGSMSRTSAASGRPASSASRCGWRPRSRSGTPPRIRGSSSLTS